MNPSSGRNALYSELMLGDPNLSSATWDRLFVELLWSICPRKYQKSLPAGSNSGTDKQLLPPLVELRHPARTAN
jgi:hypothetical protein